MGGGNLDGQAGWDAVCVFGPDGQPNGELGSVASEPGQEIATTLDRDFQSEVQKAMSVYNGAIVVLERDTGRVLAMASSPGFDSNAYEYENDNSTSLINKIVNDPRLPQFNRATQGQGVQHILDLLGV